MTGIFTLEALPARKGDSLILNYGTKAAPKLVVIDGGLRIPTHPIRCSDDI